MAEIFAFLSMLPKLFDLFMELRELMGEREAILFIEESSDKVKLLKKSLGEGKTDEEKIKLRREALRKSRDLLSGL